MVIYLNVSVKYEGVWHEPGKTLEIRDDVGKKLTDSGSAKFLGFRCPLCPKIIGGDTIYQAKKALSGHKSGHSRRKKKDEGKKS